VVVVVVVVMVVVVVVVVVMVVVVVTGWASAVARVDVLAYGGRIGNHGTKLSTSKAVPIPQRAIFQYLLIHYHQNILFAGFMSH
jgi:hypothetical protein